MTTTIGKAARIEARGKGELYPGCVGRITRTGRLIRITTIREGLVIAKFDGKVIAERASDVALVA